MINRLGKFLSAQKPRFFFLLAIVIFLISFLFHFIQTLIGTDVISTLSIINHFSFLTQGMKTNEVINLVEVVKKHIIEFFDTIRYLLRLIGTTSIYYGIGLKLLTEINLRPTNTAQIEEKLRLQGFKGEDIEDQLLLKYYQQSLEQSNISFWFSLGMGSLGLFIILSAIFSLPNQKNEVVQMYINIVSGIVIQSVSALIFVQSNKATKTMIDFAEKIRLDRWMRKGITLTDTIGNEDLKSKVKAIITMNLLGIKISDSDKEVLAKITDYDKSIGSTYNPEDKKNI